MTKEKETLLYIKFYLDQLIKSIRKDTFMSKEDIISHLKDLIKKAGGK